MENIQVYAPGRLFYQGKEYHCSIGRSGISTTKKEGDGVTPAGCFALKEVWYRKDRVTNIETVLPTHEITQKDGWSIDSRDQQYNQHVDVPYQTATESFWREDNIYDVIVAIGFNDDPPVPGKGSAIFIHIARAEYPPTEGCIALAQEDLLAILKAVQKDTLICVT